MATNGTHKVKVAIIGAGLTGLLAAHGLRKNGFDVAVFEREKYHGERLRDWTILIHWAMPLFTKLLPEHLVEKLPEALTNANLTFDASVESISAYNGVTGERLFTNPTPGARRVSRQRLRALLVKDLQDAGVIRWNKHLASLEEQGEDGPVKLSFEGGETYEADYVLGADGVASKVRELLFRGDEAAKPQYSGYYFATAIPKYGDAAKVDAVIKPHPVATIIFAKDSVGGCGVMHAHPPDDKSQWSTFWVKIWRKSVLQVPEDATYGQKALDFLRATTKGLAEPFQSYIDWTPDGSECYINEMRVWTSQPFDNRGGRVTLAGDAAHAMLLYRGQGFQHAILDATQYLDALVKIRDAGAKPSEVIAAYDKDMVERGEKAVTQSLKEAELSMDLNTVNQMLMVRKGHGKDT
ncbi:hypothetical protein VTJ49DRAFT_7152 [Mycothermus thermophilus]|uniref:FAD-binding domain-containing protein n=1 Tax=Humicola insolens TaxID=85995 RepID=A0ABR3VIV0_HUMIN